jgi:hypothetical protein
MKCFYGISILEPSTIEEFDRCEGPRIITHTNHPMKPLKVQDTSVTNIWLKTYGLKAFMIECPTDEVDSVIKKQSLLQSDSLLVEPSGSTKQSI